MHPPDIFISYAREDEAWVAGLAAALQASGRSVFWDRRVPAGKTWRDHIGAALERARCVVVVWSDHSIVSKFVLEEADEGKQRDVLVPVLRNPVRPPFGFREIHAADLSDWSPGSAAPALDALLADLRALLGAPTAATLTTLDREVRSKRRGPPPQQAPEPPAPAALPSAGRTWQPGRIFRDADAPWCPEMVVIPAGSFTMGSPPTEIDRYDDEGPQRTVTFARPFALGRFTVKFAEWDACVAAGGCGGYKPADKGWGRGRQPVVNVSWEDAQAYAAWLAARTGAPYRLPTEAEWEYAARAGTTTPFWTGATISTEQANYDGNYTYDAGEKGSYRKRTVAVDDPALPANPFGLHHVHGNVWECVQDCYRSSYVGAPLDGSVAVEASDPRERVIRGGSWDLFPSYLRSAIRSRYAPGLRKVNVGFRVARMLTP